MYAGKSEAAHVHEVFNPNAKEGADSKSNLTVTIPFHPDPDTAKHVPYILQRTVEPKRVCRLTMTGAGTKRYVLTGRQYLTLGRDDAEENILNNVPLEILPGIQEEHDRADEFALLNGLFSRTHARLEVQPDGIYLLDCRTGGIRDATILDNRPLNREEKKLMFSHDTASDAPPKNVLFSKMLSMTFKPHTESLWRELRRERLPETFPLELLNRMYSFETSAGISSVRVTPEQHFKQKNYAGILLSILKRYELSIAEDDWWKQWFNNTNNVDPRHATHEYWFIPSFVTLGGLSSNKIRLGNQWNDVRLRILCIEDHLYTVAR